jgi:hypothetical protein
MADAELTGKIAQTPGRGQCADRDFLFRGQFTSAGAVPRAHGRVTLCCPPRSDCEICAEVLDWYPTQSVLKVLKVRVRIPSLPPSQP